jgi:hypothetical protein
MGKPGTLLAFEGVVESGAPLAIWDERPNQPSSSMSFHFDEVMLECRPRTSEAELLERWTGIDPLAARERIARAARLARGYESDGLAGHGLWVWELGDAIFVAHPGEAYSKMQMELRQRNPERVIFVLNLTNGPGFMYLPPATDYEDDHYQVWQSLLAKGSLEVLVDAADRRIKAIVGGAGSPWHQ